MATYTFENIVINGVDTSKTYNDSTLPISGVKRIICNGEDKLHKNVNKTISNTYSEGWNEEFLLKYKTKVLEKVIIGDGVKSIEYIYDGTKLKGFIIEFEMPSMLYYRIEENDTVAGGLVLYDTDTVHNVLTVKLEFNENSALQITATNTSAGIYYDKTIEPDMYDLNIEIIEYEIKGRVY